MKEQPCRELSVISARLLANQINYLCEKTQNEIFIPKKIVSSPEPKEEILFKNDLFFLPDDARKLDSYKLLMKKHHLRDIAVDGSVRGRTLIQKNVPLRFEFGENGNLCEFGIAVGGRFARKDSAATFKLGGIYFKWNYSEEQKAYLGVDRVYTHTEELNKAEHYDLLFRGLELLLDKKSAATFIKMNHKLRYMETIFARLVN